MQARKVFSAVVQVHLPFNDHEPVDVFPTILAFLQQLNKASTAEGPTDGRCFKLVANSSCVSNVRVQGPLLSFNIKTSYVHRFRIAFSNLLVAAWLISFTRTANLDHGPTPIYQQNVYHDPPSFVSPYILHMLLY